MSVRVKLKSLSEEEKRQTISALTFEYKENNILINSKYKSAKKKTVLCYIAGEVYAYIPCYWAWKNMKCFNNYFSEKRDYKIARKPRDDKQEHELRSVIDMLSKKRTVALTVRTGAGKTAVSLFCACHFKEFTVVLVHIDNHCIQWYNSVKTYTTAVPQIVTLEMNGISYDTDILICLYTRWHKVPKIISRNIGLLIIDECDEYCNPTGIESILSFNPLRIIGCTATFERPGTGLHTMMNEILGHTYVTREFDVIFKVTKINTGIKGDRLPAKYTHGCDWLHLKQSLLYNDERNKLIGELVLIRLNEGFKIFILCTEVKHIACLYKLFISYHIDCDFLCGEKNNYKDSDVLIGSTKKCGRGFDEESFCDNWNGVRINCVMIVDYVNNTANLKQWIGRGFRAEFPRIDHFVDNDRTIEKQWNECCLVVYKEFRADLDSCVISL